ncbi:symmetrical bis(5'-nucleosyl)-tetraphosphatase [Chitinibacter tainanensis]|uniref:symmetrical bis(5'-nucleosyl)-tetraphosphatase n=1 Tax=Chitinibacter tainanensis TaxID=230667 RepID=UPI00041C9D82|nr:symmetrical bis(5'-nucleosyl)-tetraphosphatase [Chitinibacter tainanensis]
MATYVIGDVQGCFAEFSRLLALVRFNPAEDRLIFLGDLVNRGPGSREVLAWAYTHRDHVELVLGNHDLHLLACWLGFAQPKGLDTLAEILADPDCESWCEWLLQQPLLLKRQGYMLSHAGINPVWGDTEGGYWANFARERYSSAERKLWFAAMYGNKPRRFDINDDEEGLFRFAINSFTRMRFCEPDGKLDFKFKGELDTAPHNLQPWFVVREQLGNAAAPVLFGHWSALGVRKTPAYVALDSGCVWGGALTAFCLETGELFSQAALAAYQHIEA